MGCDTKGFIATNNKDVWEVREKINNFLKTRYSKKESSWLNQIASVGATFELSDGYFTVVFVDGEDVRQLFVFFNCDCDYSSVKQGSKIIFNLGCWGKSDELILGILAQFEGEKYYNNGGEEWERV